MQRTTLLRAARTTLLRRSSPISRQITTTTLPRPQPPTFAAFSPSQHRFASTNQKPSNSSPLSAEGKSLADAKIEEITELYATAQDEFEIAMEETEKQTVYAEEDRKAAREELERVQEAYRLVVEGEDVEVAEEVKRRIGQRIRELEHGVKAMEEFAMNQD